MGAAALLLTLLGAVKQAVCLVPATAAPLWTVQAGGTTALTVDTNTGVLVSIVHAPSAAEFVAGGKQSLFTLQLVRGMPKSNSSLTVRSSEFRRIVVVRRSPTRLELAFSDHPGAFGHALGLSANATIFASPPATSISGPLVHFRLAVSNVGSWAVQSALYPAIEQRADLGLAGGGLDELLFPCSEGVVIPNPGLHVGLADNRGFYPNGCPVQFAARYGARAGSRQPDFHAKTSPSASSSQFRKSIGSETLSEVVN